MLSLSILRPEYMSIRDLNRGIAYLHRNHQDSQTLEVAFWARIFYPLNALLLAFSAVPFAFGALRSGGLGKRIFLGIVMAVAWYFSQRALVNLGAVYGVHLAVANLVPALILGTLIVLYFRRHA
jgi:lipopolysaccharide export system permease protein